MPPQGRGIVKPSMTLAEFVTMQERGKAPPKGPSIQPEMSLLAWLAQKGEALGQALGTYDPWALAMPLEAPAKKLGSTLAEFAAPKASKPITAYHGSPQSVSQRLARAADRLRAEQGGLIDTIRAHDPEVTRLMQLAERDAAAIEAKHRPALQASNPWERMDAQDAFHDALGNTPWRISANARTPASGVAYDEALKRQRALRVDLEQRARNVIKAEGIAKPTVSQYRDVVNQLLAQPGLKVGGG